MDHRHAVMAVCVGVLRSGVQPANTAEQASTLQEDPIDMLHAYIGGVAEELRPSEGETLPEGSGPSGTFKKVPECL